EIFALADRVTVLRDGASVGTNAVDGLTESQMIQLMVGREVDTLHPAPQGEPGEIVLNLENLGCAASGVSGVSLNLRAGQILGLAGLVGAGRTELARILFGITPADCGTIRLFGNEVRIADPRMAVELGIAYVPEDRRRHGVILDMPIVHNIALAVHRRLFPRG